MFQRIPVLLPILILSGLALSLLGAGPAPQAVMIADAPHVLQKPDFDEHVRQLKKKLPHDGFTVIVQKPFVVIGDEPPATVQGRSERTVKWAVDNLKASFFEKEFYDDPHGTDYAQARYLCYYLQEHDLLRKFYRRFRANAANDPTGYKTLMSVLGTKDMTRFQGDWEGYVLELRYP